MGVNWTSGVNKATVGAEQGERNSMISEYLPRGQQCSCCSKGLDAEEKVAVAWPQLKAVRRLERRLGYSERALECMVAIGHKKKNKKGGFPLFVVEVRSKSVTACLG
jgi:hypothetical protein